MTQIKVCRQPYLGQVCRRLICADGQYVDLALNPERFTGYAGPSAHHVWQTIYDENCFGLSEGSLDTPNTDKLNMGSMAGGLGGASPAGFSRLSEGFGTDMIKSASEGAMCEEKKVYYRIISGQSSFGDQVSEH